MSDALKAVAWAWRFTQTVKRLAGFQGTGEWRLLGHLEPGELWLPGVQSTGEFWLPGFQSTGELFQKYNNSIKKHTKNQTAHGHL